jgi:hypothetical protein
LSGCPDDATVECDNIPDAANVTATDNCSTPTVTFNETSSLDECGEGTITRTWTATDDCGNTATCTQILTVVDTTDPVLSGVPADATVECDNIPDPASPSATDNCDNDVDISFSETSSLDECGEGTITRTWTATDCAGNSVSASQTLMVVDTTDPVLSGEPADATVECDDIPDAPTLTATDNCDNDVDVSFSETSSLDECGEGTITRTWTATDCAGNTASHTQTLTVEDTTPPVFTSCPDDLYFDCLDDVPTADPDSASATDDCGDVTISVSDSDNGGAGCEGDPLIITRTYTATDCAGNEAECEQIITVEDDIPPVISCPDPDTLLVDPTPGECGNSDVVLDEASATDNCADEVTITQVPETFPIGTTTVTWIATDSCGNADTCQGQIVTVRMWVDAHKLSCPNPLNKGMGDVPFAIIGCDGFDVGALDTTKILVHGVTPTKFEIVDDTRPLSAREDSCDCEENAPTDGIDDLIFKVDQGALIAALKDSLGLDSLEVDQEVVVNVNAEDTLGNKFTGRDCMVVKSTEALGGGPQTGANLNIPKVFALSQNNPNPFNKTTVIRYQLPRSEHASLKVYDVTGRLVRTLVNGKQKPGYYTLDWDGKDNKQRKVASGIYFLRFEAAEFSSRKKMTLLR